MIRWLRKLFRRGKEDMAKQKDADLIDAQRRLHVLNQRYATYQRKPK